METKDSKFRIFLKSFFKQIGVILLYFIISFTLQVLLYNFLTSENKIIEELSYLSMEFVLLIVFLIIFRKTFQKDIPDFIKNGKNHIKNNCKYWLCGLFIMIVTNLIISFFIGMPSNETAVRDLLEKIPIYSIFSTVIIAPIVEELLTRVILKDKVKPDIIYFVLSGLIFGALHMLSATSVYELFYIIPYGALGYSFAVIYKKSDNVLTNMFFHSMHNLLAILIIFSGV